MKDEERITLSARREEIAKIFSQLADRLDKAYAKHPSYDSAYHGISVIREEFEELWEEVRKDNYGEPMTQEALDVAATAIRFILDVRKS